MNEIVGKLTKPEVMGCLPPGWIRAGDGQTWETLEAVVHLLLDNMKAVIYKAAHTKERLIAEHVNACKKRKVDSRDWRRQL